MADPLTQLSTDATRQQPSAEFADRLRARVDAIEARAEQHRVTR